MNRVAETSKVFQTGLENLGINTRLEIRNTFSYLNNDEYYPMDVTNEWIEKFETSGKSEDEFVEDFLDGKRRTKPEMLAKNYLKDMERIFKHVIYKKNQFSIVSFRHGAKSADGNLSESGKKQAESLGNKIGQNIDEYKNTIFIATHNMINESIVRCLIDNNNLPDKWRKPLDFTETVRYTFYPESENKESGNKKPHLKIEWRGIKKEITFDDFKKCISGLENKN